MTPTPNFASRARIGAEAGDPASSPVSAGPFVLNLCSSTTPMALAQTDLPELKRFTFFVSRRFEEGRERFRLHMGYFATLAEAEEWLSVVREIYPGAWAGEAPGRKIRERAAAAAAAAQHAAGPQAHAAGPHAIAGPHGIAAPHAVAAPPPVVTPQPRALAPQPQVAASPPHAVVPQPHAVVPQPTGTQAVSAETATSASTAVAASPDPAPQPLRVPVVHAAPPVPRVR